MKVVAPFRLQSYGLTDIGRTRKTNEDAYRCDDALGLFVVADGVGGRAKGEVASAEAVDQIFGFVSQGRDLLAQATHAPNPDTHQAVRRLLESAVQSACYMVFGMGELDPAQKGMSTTISALLIAGRYAVTAQVGDSRIYRIRDGQGAQLTEDHTLINQKLKKGLISEADVRTMKGKNVITRAVGHQDYVAVDTRALDARVGDRYLLCSDGLHGYLKAGELEQVMSAVPSQEAPARFIDMANRRGGKDNITVVAVFVEASEDKRTKIGF